MNICESCRSHLGAWFDICWRLNKLKLSGKPLDRVQEDLAKIYGYDGESDRASLEYAKAQDFSLEIIEAGLQAHPNQYERHYMVRARSWLDPITLGRNYHKCWFCRRVHDVLSLKPINSHSSDENMHESRTTSRAVQQVAVMVWISADLFDAILVTRFSRNLLLFTSDRARHVMSASYQPVIIRHVLQLNPPTTSNQSHAQRKLKILEMSPNSEYDTTRSCDAGDGIAASGPAPTQEQHQVVGEPNFQGRLRTIRNWLNACSSHLECHKARNGLKTHSDLPKRLVQVEAEGRRLCVVDVRTLCDSHDRSISYLTLSYCWGQDDFLNLTAESLDMMKKGFSADLLPLTLQHALILCYELSFEYIWIDCLCIVQGSDQQTDWMNEASRMHIVYGNASLNIAAAAGHSVHSGLFFPRSDTFVEKAFELPGGITLMPKFFPLKNIAQQGRAKNPLLYRGWVQQEVMMAQRVLFWSQDQLFWRCHCGLTYETRWPLNVKIEAIGSYFHKDYFHSNTSQWNEAKSRIELAWAWCYVATSFSRTNVTRAQDRYWALSGLAAKMLAAFAAHGAETQYIAGFWDHDLVRWIAWSAGEDTAQSSKIRQTTVETNTTTASVFIPSWSWLSLRGSIFFLGFERLIALGELQDLPGQWQSVAQIQDKELVLEDEQLVTGALKWAALHVNTTILDFTGVRGDDESNIDGGQRIVFSSIQLAYCQSRSNESESVVSNDDRQSCVLDSRRWETPQISAIGAHARFDRSQDETVDSTIRLKFAVLGKSTSDPRDDIYWALLIRERPSNGKAAAAARLEYERVGTATVWANKHEGSIETASGGVSAARYMRSFMDSDRAKDTIWLV